MGCTQGEGALAPAERLPSGLGGTLLLEQPTAQRGTLGGSFPWLCHCHLFFMAFPSVSMAFRRPFFQVDWSCWECSESSETPAPAAAAAAPAALDAAAPSGKDEDGTFLTSANGDLAGLGLLLAPLSLAGQARRGGREGLSSLWPRRFRSFRQRKALRILWWMAKQSWCRSPCRTALYIFVLYVDNFVYVADIPHRNVYIGYSLGRLLKRRRSY